MRTTFEAPDIVSRDTTRALMSSLVAATGGANGSTSAEISTDIPCRHA
eukprot:CAMPEP_0185756726 /NCGR_PEP_ID=MMETSP1174-20130828/15139_1 /TAXON_ID=35687 /ORGANISM="Dictyocha speculum, Strain CCMP1381" /LENGTH=47 /DNA_ID= /DNA_START= /DNA_END= /DNA_ORIENTATION=